MAEWVKIRTQNVVNRMSKLERALGSDGVRKIGEQGIDIAKKAMDRAYSGEVDPVSNRRWKKRRRPRKDGKPLLAGLNANTSAAWEIRKGRLRVALKAPQSTWPGSKMTQAALIFIHKHGVKKRLSKGAYAGEKGARRKALREAFGADVVMPKRRSFGISRAEKKALREYAVQIAHEGCVG